MFRRLRQLLRRRPVTPEEAEARAEEIKARAELERIPASSPGINPGSYSGGP